MKLKNKNRNNNYASNNIINNWSNKKFISNIIKSKKAGFGSIIGFMFSFFIIVGLFVSAFMLYQNQVSQQIVLKSFTEKQLASELNLKIDLSKPLNYSNKVEFLINVIGSEDLKIKNNDGLPCIDIYLNGNKYISKNDFFIFPFYDISKEYKIIESGKKGSLVIKNITLSSISSLKLISCEGKEFNWYFNDGEDNWFNKDWDSRKRINIRNNFNGNLNEYQAEINLNSSNFDFSKASLETIRFELPLKENLILDLGLDYDSQIQKETSKYSNIVYLGSDSIDESEDPSFNSNLCVIDNCYNFDGDDDMLLIKESNSLLIDNQISIFSWVKWNKNGDSLQNIFTNGIWSNALRIVNDGSSNQDKILFELNINGNVQSLYSNSKLDNNWHFVGAVFDGEFMKIYIDGKLDSISTKYMGNIIYNSNDNYIGAESSNSYNFNGTLDEFKLFDIALRDDEVLDLYHNYLGFRLLDYDIVNYDSDNYKGKFFVKIPRIINSSNINFDLYYNYNGDDILNDESSIENTYSYSIPRLVGFIVSDRIASNTGISFMSLYDNNNLTIGSNSFNLDSLDSGSISTSDLDKSDAIYMQYLSQVEGDGNADDIIVPLSYMGTEFYYRGFRASGTTDTFCMLAPYNDSWVEIRDAGTLVWNDTITSTSNCISLDIGSSDNLAINSTTPILISYYGGSSNDAFVFFPATNDDLFGSPSSSGYLATGVNGVDSEVFRSDSSLDYYSLGSYGSASISSGGNSGDVAGHRIVSLNGEKFGAIQQADHDGTESSIFVSKSSFSTIFGSALANEYITLVSDFPNANCKVFDENNNLISQIENGVGDLGIFKYDFDTGNDNTFVSGKWYVKCDKPVWGYYEEDGDGDETNMFGLRQMRQIVYPEPSIIIK